MWLIPLDAGTHGGYPLHHAAKRGLDKTVLLLLSRGGTFFVIPSWYVFVYPCSKFSEIQALLSHKCCCCTAADPLAVNDDSLTPLDMARARGHVAVVRMIEVFFFLSSPFMFDCGLKFVCCFVSEVYLVCTMYRSCFTGSVDVLRTPRKQMDDGWKLIGDFC